MGDVAPASNPKTTAPASSADAVKQGIDAIKKTGGGTAITSSDKMGTPGPADKNTLGVVEWSKNMVHNMYTDQVEDWKNKYEGIKEHLSGKFEAVKELGAPRNKNEGKLAEKAAKSQSIGAQKGAVAEAQAGRRSTGSADALKKGREATAGKTMKKINAAKKKEKDKTKDKKKEKKKKSPLLRRGPLTLRGHSASGSVASWSPTSYSGGSTSGLGKTGGAQMVPSRTQQRKLGSLGK